MQGRKYVNIGLVVLEIQKAEFGNFTVPVNNTLVCLTSSFVFLAAATLLCVLTIESSTTIYNCHQHLYNINIYTIAKYS